MKLIGNNIEYYRRTKGMSQAELAQTAGVGVNTVSRYESGGFSKDGPSVGTLQLIADALEIELFRLFISRESEPARPGFGLNIKKLRGNVSQETLGEALGESASTVSQWENELRVPNDTQFEHMALIFKKPVSFIKSIKPEDVYREISFDDVIEFLKTQRDQMQPPHLNSPNEISLLEGYRKLTPLKKAVAQLFVVGDKQHLRALIGSEHSKLIEASVKQLQTNLNGSEDH